MIALRVLHVDDEPDIRDVVEMSLNLDSDLVTRSCCSGPDALAVAADWTPDIILMDVMMPVMDGPATLAKLQDNSKTANIPVVFMTARAQARELDIFRSHGAVGVISKPFDPMTLAASVRAYVQPPGIKNNSRFSTLENVFLQRVVDDSAALAAYRSELISEADLLDVLIEIKRIAHGLSGAGGIFGFSEISEAAASLEETVIYKQKGSGSVEGIQRALDHLLVCMELQHPDEETLREV